MSHRIIRFGSALLCLLAASGPAWAHAHLKMSMPSDGEMLNSSPSEIRLDFTEGLEPAFSGLTITAQSGQPVDITKPTVSGIEGHELSTSTSTPLSPGSYTVQWHVLSKDGHATSGTYHFRVMP